MVKTRKKIKFSKLDKFMGIILILLLIAMPIFIVYSKSVLSASNIEVEKIKSKIERQEAQNESFIMKINELASLSNVQDIAKNYGLSYINDNIIIIK